MCGLLLRGRIRNSMVGRAFCGQGGNDKGVSQVIRYRRKLWVMQGPRKGSRATREEENRKRGVFQAGEEVWRHSFPMFFVLASPGFGVSVYLQCGIQGERVGTQLRSIRFLFCTESNHWYQSGYLEENLIQNTYGFNILKGLFIFTCWALKLWLEWQELNRDQIFLPPLLFIMTSLSSVLALLRASFCREWRMESGRHKREAKTAEHQWVPVMY